MRLVLTNGRGAGSGRTQISEVRAGAHAPLFLPREGSFGSMNTCSPRKTGQTSGHDELDGFRELAKVYIMLSAQQVDRLLRERGLV